LSGRLIYANPALSSSTAHNKLIYTLSIFIDAYLLECRIRDEIE
jgi:hypothetical protein